MQASHFHRREVDEALWIASRSLLSGAHFARWLAMTKRSERVRQISPTGKSFPFFGSRVKRWYQKYFCFTEVEIRCMVRPSHPARGACARHERAVGCGGREVRKTRRVTRTAKSCGSDAPMLASSS